MTTITINEHTKAGKTLLELAKMLAVSNKGVVIETTESDSKGKSTYSQEFIEKIKRAETDIKKGDTTTVNPDDIWGSLDLK